MNKKLLKLKPIFTLNQADQDQRDTVIENMKIQGLPEQAVDSYIYRVGLDITFKQTQKQP